MRETQGGRATLSFDYRIVARPFDAEHERLAPAAGTSVGVTRAANISPMTRSASQAREALALPAPAPLATKTYDCSSGTACVYGNSSGANTSGVSGISSATSGFSFGVKGTATRGTGVYGLSTSGGNAGVTGKQLNTSSNSGIGVSAETTGSHESAIALFAVSDGLPSGPFEELSFLGENVANGADCYIDQNADLTCNSGMEARSLRLRHATRSGKTVSAYASESASASLSDVGTARLVNGVANVRIDRTFGSTIDRNGYYVFLTPMGETRGLYVGKKTRGGFEVREVQEGRSTLAFDYRIFARPLDAPKDRLPPAPPLRKPVKPN